MKAGRPIIYTKEIKQEIIREYSEACRADKVALADKHGIDYRSLVAYVCKWRKDQKNEPPALANPA